jgi:hypothetical protein
VASKARGVQTTLLRFNPWTRCNKTGIIIFGRAGGEGRGGEGNVNIFSHKCLTLLKLFTYEKIQNLKINS